MAGQPHGEVAVVSQRPQTNDPGMIAEPHFPGTGYYRKFTGRKLGEIFCVPRMSRCDEQDFHERILLPDPIFCANAEAAGCHHKQS